MRRRRTKSTWFPINPTYYGEQTMGVTWYQGAFDAPSEEGVTTQAAIPVTLDDSSDYDNDVDQQSLRDYVEGQDYLLQRVVGKVWMSQNTSQAAGGALASIGCMALAILPSEPGTNQPSIGPEDWNPLLSRNAQQPWIWRRTWKFQPYDLFGDLSPSAGKGFPSSTAWYGAVADGGHLDSKVKRRITKEHRLFIIAAAGVITGAGEPTDTNFTYGYDLRALGVMRRGKNVSSF